MNKSTTNTLSRQKKYIIIFALLAIILALLYFLIFVFFKDPLHTVYKTDADGDVLLASIVNTGSDTQLSQYHLEELLSSGKKGNYDVQKGETDDIAYTFRAKSVNISYRPFIYPEIPSENISQIDISNKNGSFTIYRDSGTGTFLIKQAKNQSYNETSLANLIFQARYMLSLQKVDGALSDLSHYGLSAFDKPVSVTITDTDGLSNTVYIGNQSSNGYYMKHKDKPYIYIMDSSASAFFDSVNSLLLPTLIPTFETNDTNYADSFRIYKKGRLFLDSVILSQEQQDVSSSVHKIVYPSEYPVDTVNFYTVLSQMSGLSGVTTLEYALKENSRKDEIFEYYGFDVPSNKFEITIQGKTYSFITGNTFVSESVKYYYAYSEHLDVVTVLSANDVAFLEYDLINFISDNIFQVNIKEIESIDVSFDSVTRSFLLSGENDNLLVTEQASKRKIDTASFRQMYISLLSVDIEGVSDVNDTSLPLELSFVVTKKNGQKNVYSFRSLSTTRCLIELDGNAEFYTNRSRIDKIKENVTKLMSGHTIQADY